jgi:hypothetical protein
MNEVIDLLSSDDDGGSLKECKAVTTQLHSSSSRNGDDDKGGRKASVDNNNSLPKSSSSSNNDDGTMTTKLRVTENEYANAWLREKGHTSPNTNTHTTSRSEQQQDTAAATSAVKNPYAKKKPSEGTSATALPHHSTQTKKRKTMTLPQQPRELQAGLVFGEDVHHNNTATSTATNINITTLHSSSHISRAIIPTASGKHSSANAIYDDDDYVDNNDHEESTILQYPSSAQAYTQYQLSTRIVHNLPPILYHDLDFVAGNPSTIDGSTKTIRKIDNHENNTTISIPPPPKCKCRPSKVCKLVYSTKVGSSNYDRPYYCCSSASTSSFKNNINDNNKNNNDSSNIRGGCGYFAWAFTSYTIHWYRFGTHNGHTLVNRSRGFCAQDLVQGKVGDCWFLSALAVVAERCDLINRLIGSSGHTTTSTTNNDNDNYGVVEVTLFVDGHWKTIIMDNFLPCIIDVQGEKDEEESIQLALSMSLETAAGSLSSSSRSSSSSSSNKNNNKHGNNNRLVSSKFDRNVMSDQCRQTLHEINDYLHSDRFVKDPYYRANYTKSTSYVEQCTQPLKRNVTTSDLAYSKTRQNQLWGQYIEKAYAKIHGSYRAISGGQIEEAFLDLTGAPTIVYYFEHTNFNPRTFWNELLQFRTKKLPMGCGTSTSQVGLVGRHAYSILDVREIHNIGLDFFRDKLVNRTLGNVSGFTEFDGTVRLLRIRNPHGQGEWKGEFSDQSPVWERVMANKYESSNQGIIDLTTTTTTTTSTPQSPILERTMVNDGCFWIDYDSFLMGFTNVDVVLAFEGNHAMSFDTNFPTKLSNHRCSRVFEISTIERQPGEEIEGNNNTVEVYVMIIQKTKRGASLGRLDRKVSYKASDVGILVSERSSSNENELETVDGRFFGLTRNGHIRLLLDRRLQDRKLIVMPISFGHPSATDDERSFVVRVVSDAPLLVQELSTTPKMNVILQKFCFDNHRGMSLNSTGTSKHTGLQGTRSIIFEHRENKTYIYKIVRIDCLAGDGGTVLLYLVVNDEYLSSSKAESISFSIEINCRGMVCRTANGPENHEVVSKGKKFEAAWRRFCLSFVGESKSRLLAAVVQGGQDYEMGSIKCMKSSASSSDVTGPMSKFVNTPKSPVGLLDKYRKYEDFGVFASVPDNQVDCVNLSSLDEDTTIVSTEQIEMNAAILASITDNSDVAASESLLFDQDIEQAIALSLKDH